MQTDSVQAPFQVPDAELAADPQRHHELGRFRVLDGKTWNNPVIAHGRLYVRNAEEMACYRVD